MATVSTPKALRHQCLDWHTQEVLARVLKEPLGLCVKDDHRAFEIDDDDRVGCCFEETSKLRFNFLPCRGVSNNADDESPRLGLQRLRLISTGNSLPSLRRPDNSLPSPIGRVWGSRK